jgi:hypothetical protein
MSYADPVSNSGIPKLRDRDQWSASWPGNLCLSDTNTVNKNNHNKYKQLKQLQYYNLLERRIKHCIIDLMSCTNCSHFSFISSGHVGFVVDEVELEQVFSEHFSFPYHWLFHQLL